MRTLRRNKQKMYYSNLIGTAPIYERDDRGNIIYEHYEGSDGNVIYYYDDNGNKLPRDSGQKDLIYSTPVEFFANIAMSGNNEAEAVEYGLSTSEYQAVMVLGKGSIPIKEGSLIWHTSPIEYEYGGNEIEVEVNGETIETTAPSAVSSDYMVLKSSPSLNIDRFILKATNK